MSGFVHAFTGVFFFPVHAAQSIVSTCQNGQNNRFLVSTRGLSKDETNVKPGSVNTVCFGIKH